MTKRQTPDVLRPSPDIHDYPARRYLRTPAAAVYTGVPASTLTKLRMRGTGPAYLKLGSNVIYDIQDLDGWLAAGRRTSTSENPPQQRRRSGGGDATAA